MTTLVVSEVFGPTVQGEGPSMGKVCAFLRLGRCNLHCRWCDTPYTWDWTKHDPTKELRTVEVDELVADLLAYEVPRIVVTGGEPMLQRHHLPELIEPLNQQGVVVEIETNGTIAPTAWLHERARAGGVQFNVSPKLDSAEAGEQTIRVAVLGAFVDAGAVFKFVCSTVEDVHEVAALKVTARLPRSRVYVMPEGRDVSTISEHLRAVAEAAIEHRLNLTTRLHVTLWGDARGH